MVTLSNVVNILAFLRVATPENPRVVPQMSR